MKRKLYIPVLALTLASSFTFSSCIGSFALYNKLLGWNKQVGNKFVNELIFAAFWILPAYPISFLADILVLNSVEFWSGNKLVADSEKIIEGRDGSKYLVQCDGKGYTITSLKDQSSVRLDFNDEDNSWNYVTPEGDSVKLLTFIDDTHVEVPAFEGTRIVELTSEGVMAYQEYAGQKALTAQR